jgi:glucan biosynthesis protein C
MDWGPPVCQDPVMTQAQALSDSATDMIASTGKSGRDLSIDYLRTTLTLMVLAHHSSLAYTSWAHFNKEHIFRSTAPVVDGMRWAFFDYAENFNDVFFMSLMFFVSGLFVYPALRKHGTVRFIRDRIVRLGVPFAFAVVLLMPIAYYASWQLSDQNRGFIDFYKLLARDGFPAGPPWFIWVLLLFDVALAVVLVPLRKHLPVLGRCMENLKHHNFVVFVVMFVFAALIYLPLLSIYGFGTWTVLFVSPFAFQICRIGLYALWFVFGGLIGVPGFENGLLSRDGSLVRHWPLWALVCIAAYNALWFVPRLSMVHNLSAATRGAIEALLWVLSCVASSFGFLAFFRAIEPRPRPWMLSLCRSAYILYLVHYVYVLWMQRLLLDEPIPAAFKFLFVFLASTLLSWLTAQCLLRIPKLKSIL